MANKTAKPTAAGPEIEEKQVKEPTEDIPETEPETETVEETTEENKTEAESTTVDEVTEVVPEVNGKTTDDKCDTLKRKETVEPEQSPKKKKIDAEEKEPGTPAVVQQEA